MSNEKRPDPDTLLRAIQKNEAATRGRLKIFLGQAAGVGKTFAMLQAARQLQEKGVDVVIGLIETHGRADTEKLQKGLEVLPKKRIHYRGTTLEEFDLDRALKRKPQLLLIDEIAHTNAPSSRHTKRHRDVEEVLDAGIDVFTTLNVQHLESRVDIIKQITGVTVTETLPDSVIERADEVILIDLAPEELIQRLHEGKIYPTERVARALENFFKAGNLTALREMALKVATERVDQELRDQRSARLDQPVWKVTPRLAVGVFESPFSEKLIRWTRTLAYGMGAPWYGIYIDTGKVLSEEEKRLLEKNLTLVGELGGELLTAKNNDIADGMLKLSERNNITQLVVGKSRRRFWPWLMSPIQTLLDKNSSVDLYVVSGEDLERPKNSMPVKKRFAWFDPRSFGIVTLSTVLTGIAGTILLPVIGYRAVGMLFLLALTFLSLRYSLASVLWGALISAIVWNYFFIPPRFSWAIKEVEDIMLLGMYVVVAAVIGRLTTRLRVQKQDLAFREEQTSYLYHLARDLARAATLDELVELCSRRLREIFDAEIGLFLSASGSAVGNFSMQTGDSGVISWVFQNRKPAGRFTDTLSGVSAMFLPLATQSGLIGVLGLRPREDKKRLSIDERSLLNAAGLLLAVGIEREKLQSEFQESRIRQESDRIQHILLDSVSHELRTPLATITGALKALRDPALMKSRYAQEELQHSAVEASERLNRVVGNLLDMSRLESGHLTLKWEPCDLMDIINVARSNLERNLTERRVTVISPRDTAIVRADFVLLTQAIQNILDNATVYTPPKSPIEITVSGNDRCGTIAIRDFGPGIQLSDPNRVFDKFVRGNPRKSGGCGLGLSIAKRIIEEHGGEISAANEADGGACFRITLPISEGPSGKDE